MWVVPLTVGLLSLVALFVIGLLLLLGLRVVRDRQFGDQVSTLIRFISGRLKLGALVLPFIRFCQRSRQKMEPLLVWILTLALFVMGVWLLGLRIADGLGFFTPSPPQIGEVTYDGTDEPAYARLLQSRFDTVLNRESSGDQLVGGFEVYVPNAPEMLRQMEVPEADPAITLTVQGMDVSALVWLYRNLAKPRAWTIEADAQRQSNGIALNARLRYGKHTQKQWYLEAEDDPERHQDDPAKAKNELMEELIDGLIFRIVHYFANLEQNTPDDAWAWEKENARQWATKFKGVPLELSPQALHSYSLGRYHLQRYHQSRSANHLQASLKYLRQLNEQHPDYLDGLLCLGIALSENRNPGEALGVFQRALPQLTPADAADHQMVIRQAQVELAIASAKIRHYYFTWSHDAVGDLKTLIGRLQGPAYDPKLEERYRQDYAELLARAHLELALTYGLYVAYIRHTEVMEVLEHKDSPIRMDPGDVKRLVELNDILKQYRENQGLLATLLDEREQVSRKAQAPPAHDDAALKSEISALTARQAVSQIQLDQLLAERTELLNETHPGTLKERNTRLLELKPHIEQLEKQVAEQQQQLERLRQQLQGIASQQTQTPLQNRLRELDGLIANLQRQLKPLDLEQLAKERFAIVARAVEQVYDAHLASLEEAIDVCGLKIFNATNPDENLVSRPASPRGSLAAYLQQPVTPFGEQRRRNLRFAIFNAAGYTRFRLAAFKQDQQDVADWLDQADRLLQLAQIENPGHFQAWLNRGLVCLDRRREDGNLVQEAERVLRKAVALQPYDYYSREQLGLALRRRLELTGVADYLKPTIVEGRDQAQRAIELRTDSYTAHVLRAEFLTMLWSLEQNPSEREKLGGEVDEALRRGRRFTQQRYPGNPYPMWEWVDIIRQTQKLAELAAVISSMPAGGDRAGKESDFNDNVRQLEKRLDRLIADCEMEASYFWLARDFAAYYGFIQQRAQVFREQVGETERKPNRFESWAEFQIPYSAPRQ